MILYIHGNQRIWNNSFIFHITIVKQCEKEIKEGNRRTENRQKSVDVNRSEWD